MKFIQPKGSWQSDFKDKSRPNNATQSLIVTGNKPSGSTPERAETMVANHGRQALLSPKAATSTFSRSAHPGDAQKYYMRKKGKLAESVLSSGKKVPTSA